MSSFRFFKLSSNFSDSLFLIHFNPFSRSRILVPTWLYTKNLSFLDSLNFTTQNFLQKIVLTSIPLHTRLKSWNFDILMFLSYSNVRWHRNQKYSGQLPLKYEKTVISSQIKNLTKVSIHLHMKTFWPKSDKFSGTSIYVRKCVKIQNNTYENVWNTIIWISLPSYPSQLRLTTIAIFFIINSVKNHQNKTPAHHTERVKKPRTTWESFPAIKMLR